MAAAAMTVDYVPATQLPALLDDPRVLAIFGFHAGAAAPACTDPRYLQVGLQAYGAPQLEVWRSRTPVRSGRDGHGVAWASDGALMFGALQIDETAAGGILGGSQQAYTQLLAALARHGYPHLLRIWNYLDAITEGEGDQERYRQFCVGRARGIGTIDAATLPAATAIGRVDGVRVLQVYWLAARAPGIPLENPRQVSAYRYPRQYGPQPPSFARAMLAAPGSELPLLLSGTASVVGHHTLHADCTARQLEETFTNFDALIGAARQHAPGLPPQFGANSRLKVYVRDRAEMAQVEQQLSQHLGPQVPRMLLHATVCRRDLRVEIDGVHGG
ncbi:pteridine-dependent deoxygenase [Stenotrophomonas sp. YIM B06876]|uniref:chorismate transformation enzyme, FkbO/Hyg5 family n=1 Tax=Stenotrophomonas sp. YIM B06876 TaxID=3060211 RepID=UPI00273A3201|nr:pteridine-dependent deoxygenase [Stenotrophomonas sp. YIM B06876]